MTYIDTNMIPVAAGQKEEYLTHCKAFAAWVMGEGALKVIDGWEDDLPAGKTNCMNSAVLKTDGESVAIGVIVWPDKATRDAAWAKLMSDDSGHDMEIVGDGKRMIFGGFETLNET